MIIEYWNLVGFVFTVLFGSATHFFYKWSGSNKIIGLISPVNESVWEHMKLITTPMVLFSVFEYLCCGRNIENYFPAKFVSILLGMLIILVVFYTYVAILGNNFLILDICTFVVGVISAHSLFEHLITSEIFCKGYWPLAGLVGILALVFITILFTFIPPHIGLFRDSVTGKYGVSE